MNNEMTFEIFSDTGYYDMWALRPLGIRDINRTLHFNTKKEAEFAGYVIASWSAKEVKFKYD